MKYVISFVYVVFVIQSVSSSHRLRIINGENADIKNFPYQASLRYDGRHFCGGCIISDRHILTAGHCITNEYVTWPYLRNSVVTGSGSSKEAWYSHRIFNIEIHPGWTQDSSFLHDIAVIVLADKINFDERQQKVELPRHDVISGSTAILTGWGHTTVKNGKFAIQLQKLQMRLFNYTDCQSKFYDRIYKEQLCAIHSKGHGSCFGDSGSPLVANGQVVGIVSCVQLGQCASGSPDVNTNVYAEKNFIIAAMSRL